MSRNIKFNAIRPDNSIVYATTRSRIENGGWLYKLQSDGYNNNIIILYRHDRHTAAESTDHRVRVVFGDVCIFASSSARKISATYLCIFTTRTSLPGQATHTPTSRSDCDTRSCPIFTRRHDAWPRKPGDLNKIICKVHVCVWVCVGEVVYTRGI